MTPTFKGRIHTRLFIFFFIGIPVSAIYAFFWGASGFDSGLFMVLMTLLISVNFIGLLLEPVYIGLQRLRWDRDWPFAYQLFFSWVEFGLAAWAADAGYIPFFPDVLSSETWTMMLIHFGTIFAVGFFFILGPLQVLSLRWRYNGGQFGRM